jgi:hypothetical protein
MQAAGTQEGPAPFIDDAATEAPACIGQTGRLLTCLRWQAAHSRNLARVRGERRDDTFRIPPGARDLLPNTPQTAWDPCSHPGERYGIGIRRVGRSR